MEDSPSLELKLLYGKDITAFNFFQKLNVYVAASISSDKPDKKLDRAQQQRTPADKEGDGSPEWGHDLRFDLKGIDFRDSNDVFLRLDLFHEGVMFGDKPIGEVRIPLRDLTAQADGVARFVSYQVKGIDGKPNGVLSFSYKVNGAGQATGIGPVDSTNGITGYVISHHHQGNQETPLPAIGNPYPGTTLYPTVGEESASAPSAPPLETLYPPPGTYYSLTPEGYYPHHPPPPPPPPPMIYPGSPHFPGVHGAGYYYHQGPPMRPPPPHMHHHHRSWGHDHGYGYGHGPYMGGRGWGPFEEGEAWRRKSWNGR
ncbi:protein SRC2 homolog [Punica granatum]|uniref:Protein SRC2 homolog n=1 Tax=Punica granatum TaxID=22663 RepID=A0A6P8CEK7_PUNGR|nr:protein SRC2 homolog [Punica granatum]